MYFEAKLINVWRDTMNRSPYFFQICLNKWAFSTAHCSAIKVLLGWVGLGSAVSPLISSQKRLALIFCSSFIKTFCSYQQRWHQSIATNSGSQHQKQFASILLPGFNSEMVQLTQQTFQWNNHKPASCHNNMK